MHRSPSPQKSSGAFGKVFLTLVLLAAGGFGYAMFRFHESPQQTWQRLVQLIAGPPAPQIATAPLPQATPVPIATPVPTPPPVVVTPTPQIVAKPTPIDPVAWLLNHRAYWPKEAALLQPMEFPLVYNGAAVGSAKVAAGGKVGVLNIEPGFLTVSFGGGTQRVPMASTDLASLAEAAMQKAAADAAAPPKVAAVAVVTPIPTPAAKPSTMNDLLAPTEADAASGAPFVHPGLLHNDDDFKRMRASIGRQPWREGWERLTNNWHASLGYKPRPAETIVRGNGAGAPQNYPQLFNDAAAAYACAVRWRVSGDPRYAEKSVEILNAWSATLKHVNGSSDRFLAAGIYGYEFANAGEIMRTFHGWKREDFARFQQMMLTVFYPMNSDFLQHHNGAPIGHYWANWDLCNLASTLAIGVLCDKRSIYEEAIHYAKFGKGNGAIRNLIPYTYPGGLGQWQESGRDQGHTMMGIGLMGAICEMAWKQGDDLYGYDNNRFLAGCEYVAKYNLGEDVPYTPYHWDKVVQETISGGSRGNTRPCWELVYNHYVKLKGLPAPYTARMAEKVRPEGGGGDYGPNSGGFDQLGYGTLTATMDAVSGSVFSSTQ